MGSSLGTCWDVAVRTLLPGSDPVELAAHYAYPEDLGAPHVRVNFVASTDGAVTVDGRSGGLGSDADRRVFGTLRELAEVVLVGAGTVRAEDYRGARKPTRGRADPPPIAVVTGSADLDPRARLFTDTRVAPIVLTGPDAPADRLRALQAAGADIVVLDPLSPAAVVGELGAPRPAPRALRGRAAALRRPRGRRPRRRALPHRRPGARGGRGGPHRRGAVRVAAALAAARRRTGGGRRPPAPLRPNG